MLIIYNNIIPLKGFKAIAIWPFIFVRKGKKLKCTDINHEKIHFIQQKECFLLIFYLIYLIDFLYKWYHLKDFIKAYNNVCFEVEACRYEELCDYYKIRWPFYWREYFLKLYYK